MEDNFSTLKKLSFMLQLKSILIVGFLMVSSIQYAQYTDVINSNRPGESMSAFSVGKTVFQAEAGMNGLQERDNLLNQEAKGIGTDLSLRYGAFFDQFEMILDLQYQYDWYKSPTVQDTRGGLKQTIIGAKYLVYDPFKNAGDDKPDLYSWKANHSAKFSFKDLIPAVAVYAGVNIQIGNNPFAFPGDKKISPKAMLITQNHFGTKWVFVNNFIIDKIMTDYPSLGLVTTLTRGFNVRWSGFLEAQSFKSDYYSDTFLRIGAAFLIRENIQIDASISKNIKDSPEIALGGIGISWRFDQNYERSLLRDTHALDAKKSKDKKAKKSKKGNKRKDEIELEKTK